MKGIPKELIQTGKQDVAKDKPKHTSPHRGSIMITINLQGIRLSGAETLVEKLEGLC